MGAELWRFKVAPRGRRRSRDKIESRDYPVVIIIAIVIVTVYCSHLRAELLHPLENNIHVHCISALIRPLEELLR